MSTTIVVPAVASAVVGSVVSSALAPSQPSVGPSVGPSGSGASALTGGMNPATYQANVDAMLAANPSLTSTSAQNYVANGYSTDQVANITQQGGNVNEIGSSLGQLVAGADPTSLGLSSGSASFLASSVGKQLLSAAFTAAGTSYAANNAGQVGDILATGAQKSANIQSNAATQSAQTLAGAATQSADVLATGATTAAGQKVAADTAALGSINNATTQQTSLAQPYMSAGTDALATLSAGLQPGGQFNKPFSMSDATNSEAYKFAAQAGNSVMATGGTQLSSANVNSQMQIASQFEQQAFNQWLASNNLTLGALQQQIATGQRSASQLATELGQAGVSAATIQQNIGIDQAGGTTGAATAKAGGITGAATAVAGGITGAAAAQSAGVSGVSQAQADALAKQGQVNQQGATTIGNQLTSAIPAVSNAIGGAVGTGLQNLFSPSTPATTYTPSQMSSAGSSINLSNSGATTTTPMSSGIDPNAGNNAVSNIAPLFSASPTDTALIGMATPIISSGG